MEVAAERQRQEAIVAQRLDEVGRELTVAERTLQETHRQAVQAQVELERTRQQIEELKRQQDAEQTSMVAEQDRLRQELADLQANKDRLSGELAQMQDRLREAQDSLNTLQERVKELERQRTQAVSALTTLEDERATLRRAVDDLLRERNELEEAVRRLRKAREEKEELRQLVQLLDRFGQRIEENRELSSRNAITSDMEYVVALPGEPVQWVAYHNEIGQWFLFEREGDREIEYPMVTPKRGEPIQSPTLYLNNWMSAVQVSEEHRIPLLRYLGVRSGPGTTLVEAGGFILTIGEEFQPLIFRYKGIHPPDPGKLALFVHPGDESLHQKSIPIGRPLSNPYEAAKILHPGSSILLGWHSHPAGPPELSEGDEVAIQGASLERHFELIFSPEGVALWLYRDKGRHKERIFFHASIQDWQQALRDELNRQMAGLEEAGEVAHDIFARRQQAMERLTQIGRPAVPALVGLLKTGDPFSRSAAAEVLRRIGDTRALKPLYETWQEFPHPSVEEAILQTAYLSGQLVTEKTIWILSPVFSDPFMQALLRVKPMASIELTEPTLKAISALAISQRQLTIEMDVETIIGIEHGYPQLRGFGFTETLMAIASAAEAKGVRSNLKIRLVNTNPLLHDAILRSALPVPLKLADMIEMVDASHPIAEARTIAPALTPDSIRVVLEGHEELWGRADVIVRRPKEGQVVSMPGLLVAAFSMAPDFYRSLAEPLKVFVQPLPFDLENRVSARSKMLAHIILAPVPVTTLPSSYLKQIHEINQRLRQMV